MSAASAELAGRTVIATVGNTGIGRATVAGLARRGGRVYVACRSQEKGRRAVADIVAATGNEAVASLPLDLADLASVRRCAGEFLALGEPLHVLINNAGVGGQRGVTRDGFELAFGVNHLGHFALTTALLDRLAASAPARVVTVASDSHYQASGVDFGAGAPPPRQYHRHARIRRVEAVQRTVLRRTRPACGRAGHHDLCLAPRSGGLRHLAAGPVADPPADQAADDLARGGRQDLALLRHLGFGGGGQRPLLRQLPRARAQPGSYPGPGPGSMGAQPDLGHGLSPRADGGRPR